MPEPSNPPENEELVEDLPPGPDTPVITKEERKNIERSWFLGIFLALFVLTIISALVGSAVLSPSAWSQMKPEVDEVLTYLFGVATGLIAYYFGADSRGKKH